ncbi:MAG: hypothetical protein GY808_08605 [Gammaproteobacteria bacterium]|nr:hypothetical protein [Gammaproteobacteria bacterium]
MNSENNKPKKLNGLEALKQLFSRKDKAEQLSIDDESNIPVLNETIPELDEKIEIVDNYSVSLDPAHSTETVEQQMVRTYHEEEPDIPVLVDSIPETQDIKLAETDLDKQQLDLEASVEKEKADHLELVASEETTEEIIETLETEEADIATEDIRELVLEKSWKKMELLLMSHLPPQISASYLHLLNTTIEDNKQQILEELSLLDKYSIEELLKSLTTEDDKRN